MFSSPLLARLSQSKRPIPHSSRLLEIGAMAIILAAGFGTNLIIGSNHDVYAQEEGQDEITTNYDTGLILCNSNDNTPQQCDVPFRVTI